MFTKLKTFKTQFLKFFSFLNLPWGHVRSHEKFGPDRFSRFDVYWIQTNKQTDKPNLYIDLIYRSKIYLFEKPIKNVYSYMCHILILFLEEWGGGGEQGVLVRSEISKVFGGMCRYKLFFLSTCKLSNS